MGITLLAAGQKDDAGGDAELLQKFLQQNLCSRISAAEIETNEWMDEWMDEWMAIARTCGGTCCGIVRMVRSRLASRHDAVQRHCTWYSVLVAA